MAHGGTGDLIHAGTYFGDFLPALSRACTKGCKVWAFEPNPENHKCATITMLLNDINNVELFNAGLGSSATMLSLQTTDDRGNALGGGSSFVTD